MYIAPEQGQTTPGGHNFDGKRKALSLYLIDASLKKKLFIQIFHDLIHVYSHGAGGRVLMSTEISCHFGHLLLVLNHRRQ